MLSLFKREIQRELAKHPPLTRGHFTSEELAILPSPVQRYFRVCGWIGKPKMTNAALSITSMQLKMDMENPFQPVTSYQFNSVVEPVRIAYMNTRMYGFLPVSGRDKYQDGQGHMYVRLMDLFPIVDLTGAKMDRAALVTVLAETFLVPSYALQSYLTWTSIDNNTASAAITHNGITASGTFYFNDAGEFVRFETTDRYMTQKDGSLKQTKWIVSAGSYHYRKGVRIATHMSASWVTEIGVQQYAKMEIAEVRYDISNADKVFKP